MMQKILDAIILDAKILDAIILDAIFAWCKTIWCKNTWWCKKVPWQRQVPGWQELHCLLWHQCFLLHLKKVRNENQYYCKAFVIIQAIEFWRWLFTIYFGQVMMIMRMVRIRMRVMRMMMQMMRIFSWCFSGSNDSCSCPGHFISTGRRSGASSCTVEGNYADKKFNAILAD